MKKLLLLIIFLTSGICSFSQTRPPIVTNELHVQDLIWQGLEMERDSLSYWHPINSTSFTLRRPDNNFSQTYAFPSDSVFSPELNIWLCNYCTVTYEGNSVLIRRDPTCSNCWQYSEDSGATWIDLWCETSLDRTLAVAPSSVPVFRIGDFQDWPDEADLLAGVTYVGFKQASGNEGKVLRYENDTVVWGLEKVDSMYYDGLWYNFPDTIPVIGTLDSFYYTNDSRWIGNNDSITTFELPDGNTGDILYFDSIWKVLPAGTDDQTLRINSSTLPAWEDEHWELSGAGLSYRTPNTGFTGVGIGCYPNVYSLEVEADENGFGAKFTGAEIGVWSTGKIGGYFAGTGDNNVGMQAYSGTGYAGYFSSNYTPLKTDGGVWSAHHYAASNGLDIDLVSTSTGYFFQCTQQSNTLFTLDYTGIATAEKYVSDSLKVGTGTTISRSGSMAEKDFWSGTQAEYDALTPDANTIYFIYNGYGWLGLFLLLLLSIGSKAQNWNAVKVGETDVVLIMQGSDTIWVKPVAEWNYEGTLTVGLIQSGVYGWFNPTVGAITPNFDFTYNLGVIGHGTGLIVVNMKYNDIPIFTSDEITLSVDGVVFILGYNPSGYHFFATETNPFPPEGEECTIKLRYTLIE